MSDTKLPEIITPRKVLQTPRKFGVFLGKSHRSFEPPQPEKELGQFSGDVTEIRGDVAENSSKLCLSQLPERTPQKTPLRLI